jgi:hypothetical protein
MRSLFLIDVNKYCERIAFVRDSFSITAVLNKSAKPFNRENLLEILAVFVPKELLEVYVGLHATPNIRFYTKLIHIGKTHAM